MLKKGDKVVIKKISCGRDKCAPFIDKTCIGRIGVIQNIQMRAEIHVSFGSAGFCSFVKEELSPLAGKLEEIE